MNLTVRQVAEGNSEITGCTAICLRHDDEILNPCEKGTSAIAQANLYALQHLSGSIPSLIMETKTFSIFAGFTAGYHLGRFGVEALADKKPIEERTPTV